MLAVCLDAPSFSPGDCDASRRLLENSKFLLNHHTRPPTPAKRTIAPATAIPATAPELRPPLPGPGTAELDVVWVSAVVLSGLEDDSLSGADEGEGGNVMPALCNARTGAEAGVNSERSDSCHATEMGFAYAVVPSSVVVSSSRALELAKLSSLVIAVVRTS